MNQKNSNLIGPQERVLILASASTGNNIFCTPAIRLLKKHRPEATVDVVSLKKLSGEVFENNPDIGRLYIASHAWQFNWLARKYTKVIALNANAIRKLSGTKVPLISVPPLRRDLHHAEQLLQFMAGLLDCSVTDEDRHYVIGDSREAQSSVGAAFSPGAPQIVIHLGCGTTLLHGWKFFYKKRADDKKLWNIAAYINLGKALQAAIPGCRIVITGTRNESFLAREFCRSVPNSISLAGKTSVADLMALMRCSDLFIAHDCGVLHIAAASGIPLVALFGPTNQVLTGPYPARPQHLLIKKDSMADITTPEVISAAQELLSKFPGRSGG